MRFNFISNFDSRGLQHDCALLKTELVGRGHTVYDVQFNAIGSPAHVEVNIFLETVVPAVFQYATRQWVIPNPEWWLPSYQGGLPGVDQVLCKTHDSWRIFSQLVGDRATYLGFLSRDFNRPDIPRQPSFLHVAGKSSVKNTEAVLEAWRHLPYPLTVITTVPSFLQLAKTVPHVTVRSHLREEELVHLFNQCQFHVCTSQYEGYGHYLHEAMSVGALVITVDAPPMNEFGTPRELFLPGRLDRQVYLASMWKITAVHLSALVRQVMQFPVEQVQQLLDQTVLAFHDQQAAFRANLTTFMARVC